MMQPIYALFHLLITITYHCKKKNDTDCEKLEQYFFKHQMIILNDSKMIISGKLNSKYNYDIM